MQLDLQNILKKNQKNIWIDFSCIQNINQLAWMSNQNFLVTTEDSDYFVRTEKSIQTDSGFWWNFNFEYKLHQALKNTCIVPKIYFNGQLDDVKIMIQEAILESWYWDNRDNFTYESISKIQSINYKKLDFIDTKNSIDFFDEKYKQRIWNTSKLKQYHNKVIDFIDKYAHYIQQKDVLVHADFRVDNTILTTNKCYVIDWESAIIWDESLDIVWYHMGSLFFEHFEGENIFAIDVYEAWLNRFPEVDQRKKYFFSILQYFSDLTWLENYLIYNHDKKLQKLFVKNIWEFETIYEYINTQIKKL